jgi:leucine dehydrogenase
VGGSGNPSVPTARGVVCGMEAALETLKLGDLEGKTVAVQGMGNVGGPVIEFLLDQKVRQVLATDVDAQRVEELLAHFADDRLDARATAPDDVSILSSECDILSPCATGDILNAQTIPNIRARIVCGAANNQLEDADRDDRLLYERGIAYIPDFLTNRMGIVNCSNEQYGSLTQDPAIEQHLSRGWEHSIYRTVRRVLEESRELKEPPGRIALRLADELSLKPHPIFGHRGRQIITSLFEEQWYART